MCKGSVDQLLHIPRFATSHKELKKDRASLAAWVVKEPVFWRELPDEYKGDLSSARTISPGSLNGDQADDILDTCVRDTLRFVHHDF